jgi:hypothetical protein
MSRPVNRLATPLPQSVLDRFYADHAEEQQHAAEEPTVLDHATDSSSQHTGSAGSEPAPCCSSRWRSSASATRRGDLVRDDL